MKNPIIKGATLLLFTGLILGFVAYKSGYLDNPRPSQSKKPNSVKNNQQTDTTLSIDPPRQTQMMSSSKFIILSGNSSPEKDTSGKIEVSIDSLEIDPLIYSSKSGIIFDPKEMKKAREDSLLKAIIKGVIKKE